MPELHILPGDVFLQVPGGENLMKALRGGNLAPDAPCGGCGQCGKCKVIAGGREVLACQTFVERDMTVIVPQSTPPVILQEGIDTPCAKKPEWDGIGLAFDIGTTSVVCFALDGATGKELARAAMGNPQTVFGADVISRIRAALRGELPRLTDLIRESITALIHRVCAEANIRPEEIRLVSVVGNPAMQQLFLGISPENLAGVPFAPVLTEAKTIPCGQILPVCPNGQLLVVPDISGYVGADTIGCVLATGLHKAEEWTLLVDIGTNGEMVLGNRFRRIACSTAAGPALEGANIRFGMRGADGAIDHVWLEDGNVKCSVIGGAEAVGICGSGLVDAVAVALELGLLNKRGRIQREDRILPLTDRVWLTQEDIRQVQLAKGAIHAGICLMAKALGVEMKDIQRVLLAGAFGSCLNPESACRMGLLPEQLLGKTEAVGNAAGTGAKMLARDPGLLQEADMLRRTTEFLELASLPEFPRTFAAAMRFREDRS